MFDVLVYHNPLGLKIGISMNKRKNQQTNSEKKISKWNLVNKNLNHFNSLTNSSVNEKIFITPTNYKNNSLSLKTEVILGIVITKKPLLTSVKAHVIKL